MPICCATGAVWPTRPGGSKIRPIASTWNSAPPGLTVPASANCDGRPPSLRASNSRAFVFVTSASPCSLPSKSAGPLLLSRHLCPDGLKTTTKNPRIFVQYTMSEGLLNFTNPTLLRPAIIIAAAAAIERISDQVPNRHEYDRANQRPDHGHSRVSAKVDVAYAANNDHLRHQPDTNQCRNDRTNDTKWQAPAHDSLGY